MLNFFGVGGAFNVKEGNCSAYFVKDDSLIIIDCGFTTFERSLKMIDQADPNNIHIFITHTHSDHIGSLGTVIDYVHHIKKGKVKVYFPSKDIVQMLTLTKVDESSYTFKSDMTNNFCGLQFDFYETYHVGDNCYGIIMKSDKTKICYSGDCSEVPYLNKFLSGELKELYLDITDNKSKVHTMYDDLLKKVVKLQDRKRITLMHFNEGFDKERALKDGFNLAIVGRVD